MPYRPLSIEQLGLRDYLDATKAQHNGYGYNDFVKLLEVASQQKIADRFGVNWYTVHRWLTIYNKEKEKK